MDKKYSQSSDDTRWESVAPGPRHVTVLHMRPDRVGLITQEYIISMVDVTRGSGQTLMNQGPSMSI